MNESLEMVCQTAFATELGWMSVAWRGERVVRLSIGHPSAAAALASLAAQLSDADRTAEPRNAAAAERPEWVEQLVKSLQAYAAGERADFARVPVELSHLTPFQRRVVEKCRRIGPGRVKSYGELAAAAGSPGAARAVGNVMATNRFPIIIPCHRVVGSGKSLGGFSAPEGISLKRRMLQMEGVSFGAGVRNNALSRSE
jgi:methylated-DNA-[protein]-cysteine S-methyltransferase